MTRRAIKTSTYIMAPLMVGLAFCATPIVRLVLTEKWLPCVPYLQIFCITYMFWPIHTANLNAINAMGRSDYFLKLEIAKKTIGMILLLSTMRFGVMVMAYSLLISSITSQIINSWPNKRLLGYGYLEQLRDIFPSIMTALFMGGCVNLVKLFGLSDLLTLLIQVPLGAIIYIGLSSLLHLEAYQYLTSIVQSGLRFPGVDYERVYTKEFGIDLMEAMVHYALEGNCGSVKPLEDGVNLNGKRAAVLFPTLKAGKVAKMQGFDRTDNCKVVSLIPRCEIGSEISWSYDVN